MQLKNKSVFIVLILFSAIITIINLFLKENILLWIEGSFAIFAVLIYLFTSEKRLFFFTFWGVIISTFLSQYISILSYCLYFFDVILIVKLFEKKYIKKQKIKCNKIILILSISLFIINILSLIYNVYNISFILLLFGTLKKYSYLILYLFFINADIKDEDITLNLKLMLALALIQFPIIVVQFFMRITQDNITGMFGPSGTGILLQYFINMLILISLINAKTKRVRVPYTIFTILILIFCALAEVKVGLVVVPLIYIFTLVLEKKYIKLILRSIVIAIALVFIYRLYVSIYPDLDFINTNGYISNYLDYAYGTEAVNRNNFMQVLDQTILNSTSKKIFGTGLATANPSTISILEGPIAKQYDYLNIHFFSLPYLIVENGILGAAIWLGIYIYIFLINIFEYIKTRSESSKVTILIITTTLIFIYYNSAILTSNIIIIQVWYILSFINSKKITMQIILSQ